MQFLTISQFYLLLKLNNQNIRKHLTLMGVKLHFISNNVKGRQNSVKWIKLFEYLKHNLSSNGFLFLEETYSSFADEEK